MIRHMEESFVRTESFKSSVGVGAKHSREYCKKWKRERSEMALAPSTGIAIVAKKRLDGSKPPPNVTRQKGRHNTRLRRGQQVGRVMIGLSHMARSDWRQ